jgi:hypothetical protein
MIGLRRITIGYTVAAIHSIGGFTLAAVAIVNGWPWPIYLVAALAVIGAIIIAAVLSEP